jgi:hypothetical protein
MKSCEICAKSEACSKDFGYMFGYCNINFEADQEKIYKRLDSLEGCDDNPVYAAEIRKLRALL